MEIPKRGPQPSAQILMFLACALAMVGNYYIYDSIGPVADLLSQQLGFSDTQLGTLNAIYSLPNIFMVSIGLAGFVFTVLLSRTDRKPA